MLEPRYMDEVGDGSGNKTMTGDYSGTAKEFLIKPNTNETFKVSRILPFYQDSGSFDSGKYGNGIALVNGIELFVRRRGADGLGNVITIDITAGMPIKLNPHWGRLCFDENHSTYGSGAETLASRYTFTKEDPEGIILDGANGDELVCRLNDDFSGLEDQVIRVGISN